MIDPCGDAPGVYDEVLLRLADGQLVAWVFGVGLSVLSPGQWQTTDGSACGFSVSADLHVTDEDGTTWLSH